MVKKSIFALAVVALLVSVVQADNPSIKRDGDWPWTYKAIDLCKMPVYMDVGHYVQLKECNKRELKLKQVDCESIGKGSGDFPCYDGCEEIEVRANFPAIFGANLSNKHAVIKDISTYWKDDINQISGSTGGWEKLEICVKAWKTAIWKASSPDNKLKVADLTITVKPPDTGS
ncbi:MAG: hypothetical protein RQ760_15520 [Sedimentisphaerales bacterium]|nr:hypothetical protein [Sedimentisphaerales bacterium]